MTAQSKTVIKSYFETGDRPTQAQFADLVDSYQDASATLAVLSSASFTGNGNVVLSSGATITSAALVQPTITSASIISPAISSAALTAPVSDKITFSTTSGIIGTITNNDAAAGSVGEIIESSIAIGSAVSLTNNIAANITSISLTAGDWDVDANVALNINAATVLTYLYGSISTTSATLGTADLGGISAYVLSTGSTGLNPVIATGTRRIKLSGTTTVYLVCTAGFTVNSAAAYGLLRARRVR